MRVKQLFIKDKHRVLVDKRETLTLRRGYGIEGDVSAQVGSPRMVLIVSVTTIDSFSLKPGDLGENILIDAEFERLSSGQVLRFGQNALIRITFLCEPCATLEKIPTGLSKKIKGRGLTYLNLPSRQTQILRYPQTTSKYGWASLGKVVAGASRFLKNSC